MEEVKEKRISTSAGKPGLAGAVHASWEGLGMGDPPPPP
jgi:hypothetical protein